MPAEDGYTLIRRIRNLAGENGRIPAIALTAYARSEDRAKALQAGYQNHLPKPIEPIKLIAMVASLVKPTHH
jgi:CheY-like chemotaxis protein